VLLAPEAVINGAALVALVPIVNALGLPGSGLQPLAIGDVDLVDISPVQCCSNKMRILFWGVICCDVHW